LDPSLQDPEHVAVEIMQTAAIARGRFVERFLHEIEGANFNVTWKTAFRLFDAIRKPSVEDGFVAQVFGQDRDINDSVRPVLERSSTLQRFTQLVVPTVLVVELGERRDVYDE